MNAMPAAHQGNDEERRSPGTAHGTLNGRARRWATLLDRIAAGDANALGTLYDESCSLTFGLILYIVQDTAAAEDALVDTYVRVRNEVRSRAPEGDAASWLMRLARGAALARSKRSVQASDPIRRPIRRPLPPGPPGASITPFEPVHRERQRMSGALDRLTPRQRSIIQMTYFGGLSTGEVARELTLSTHQVAIEIRGAMLALRTALARVHAD